jgi:hypothetical protein
VTVARSGSAAEASAAESVQTGAVADDVVDLAAATLEGARVDRILLSARASAIIAAGLAVRAFILRGVEELHRRITVGRQTIVLDAGIYALRG